MQYRNPDTVPLDPEPLAKRPPGCQNLKRKRRPAEPVGFHAVLLRRLNHSRLISPRIEEKELVCQFERPIVLEKHQPALDPVCVDTGARHVPWIFVTAWFPTRSPYRIVAHVLPPCVRCPEDKNDSFGIDR